MLLVLLGLLVCLFPLALYVLFVAMLHQRQRPTMVGGAWDFAGALAGLSGFLLFGGTLALSGVPATTRAYWLGGGTFGELRDAYATTEGIWFYLWLGYFVLLVGGGALLMWWRSDVTVIYGTTSDDVADALGRALDRLAVKWEQRGAVLTSGAHTLVELGGSRAMRTATLRWNVTGALRRDAEAELARELAGIDADPGEVAGWLMTVAGALFLFMLACLIGFILMILRMR